MTCTIRSMTAPFRRACALLALLAVAACGTTSGGGSADDGAYGAGGRYKVGAPYQVAGIWYYPQEDPLYDETGIASWYGNEFGGRKTANGEIFRPNLITAAHKTLPMPVNVRVTNLENGKSIVARVNDRGPFKPGRIIDMSEKGAELLGYKAKGVARVRVQFVGVAELPDGKPGKRISGNGEEADIIERSNARAVPAGAVESTALDPVDGAAVAEAMPAAAAPPVPVPQSSPLDEPDGTVRDLPVNNGGRIYVQAGAFLAPENAERLMGRIGRIADFEVSPKTIDGKRYYRVRAGPFANVDDADRVLDQVLSAGQSGARIVVE